MKKIIFYVMLIFISSHVFAGTKDQEKKQIKPVLVVMDIQNEFLPDMSENGRERALMIINAAIELFRQHDYPVIRVYHTSPKWGPKQGTEAFEFPSSVKIKPDDPKIVKNYGSAFKDTELEELLKEKDCNTVFLCGLSATACVLATYHSAMERDYNVFMVEGALMSSKSANTEFIEKIMETVNYKTLRFILDYTEK